MLATIAAKSDRPAARPTRRRVARITGRPEPPAYGR